MLSSDEPIALLIEKLDALAKPDQAAILKRLSPPQRARLARLRTRRSPPALEAHSAELVRRIAELDSDRSPLTTAAREALARAIRMKALSPERDTARTAPRGSSLADAAGSLFQWRTAR